LIKEVDGHLSDYEPTRAARAIQEFVIENLSNWYVRLNRKRYWGGEFTTDKIAAYQTLFTCLKIVSQLMAPIAPFYAERMYLDLCMKNGDREKISVHLTNFPEYDKNLIDEGLENRMKLEQKISSMVLGLRRKVSIKVRQPLNKLIIPVLDNKFKHQLEKVKNLILSEINVRQMEFISDTGGILVKKIRPNFKSLGPRYGKLMKEIANAVQDMSQEDINAFEEKGEFILSAGGEQITLIPGDAEVSTEDIPGWLVANDGPLTVALDITITDNLKSEGIAREFINRIQNYRKESGFDVTDKIKIQIKKHRYINKSVEKHKKYIGDQTLADTIILVDELDRGNARIIEFEEGNSTWISIERV
jgi:isoleucyl-tRNA synthetase